MAATLRRVRRADLIVAPKRLGLFARIPGLIRPIVDRIGFPGSTIPDAIAQASPTRWNRPRRRPAVWANYVRAPDFWGTPPRTLR
ncbi:hypothetical protein GCM10027262_49690 [Nocardia tengchongensis]